MLKKLKNVNLFLVIMIVAFVFGISLKIVFADYLFNSQPKGISVGNTGVKLECPDGHCQNLIFGEISNTSTGDTSFLLLQTGEDHNNKFKVDRLGNISAAGNIEASGNMKASGQNVCLQNGTNCPAAGIPSDLVAGSSVVSDAEVDNNITLDNITQITNRSHSNLQNLTADDHTQYLRADGGRAMSGALTANGGINLQNNGDTDYKIEGRRSIGEYPGWDANRLYINGYNDWSSGVTVAGAGLNVDAGLNVAGVIKQGGAAVSLSGHAHSAGDITSGTLLTGRGGTGLSATGASGNLLRSNGSTWESWAPNYLTSEVDGSVTNEIQNITASQGLARDGSNNFGIMDCAANEIVKRNAGDTAWACVVDGGGVTAHSALSGLGNDDHTQYLRADGGRAMSGALQMSASGENNITAIDALVGYNDLYVKGSSAEDKPIYYGASEHKFYTGKTERARINSSGNLTVWGAIGATGSINTSDNIKTGGTARIDSSGNLTNIGAINASGNIVTASSISSASSIFTTDGVYSNVGIFTAGTKRIDSAGNLVNIGTINASNTITASSNMIVANGLTVSGGTLSLPNNSITDAMVSDTLTASNYVPLAGDVTITGGLNVAGNVGIGTTAPSYIMGDLGIGVKNPSEKLDVNGNIKASGAITASGAIHTDSHITASGSVYMGYKKEFKDCGAVSYCQVDCETGKVVLGGGCSSYKNTMYLYQSKPTEANTGWICVGGGSSRALAVYAICARMEN